VFDLKIQVASEPIVKSGLFNVARRFQLQISPSINRIVVVNVHHNVIAL
jgi:hypothetical protein